MSVSIKLIRFDFNSFDFKLDNKSELLKNKRLHTRPVQMIKITVDLSSQVDA